LIIPWQAYTVSVLGFYTFFEKGHRDQTAQIPVVWYMRRVFN
jgi:hypothetical protein